MHATRAGTLIETVEELAWVALDAHTIINHLQDSCLRIGILGYTHLNLTTIVGVLEGVREQIVDHLIDGLTIEPHTEFIERRRIAEVDMTLVGSIFVRLEQVAHILYHIGFLALQLHLLAVHLTDIKYLVHQILHALGVMLDGLQLVGYLWVEVALQQFVQRTHDERQRRADIVGGVDEELHLILVQLLATTTNIAPNQGACTIRW